MQPSGHRQCRWLLPALGVLCVGALVALAVWRHANRLPAELYDPTAPDGVREAILRRLVRERPAEARPGLLLCVADLPEGKDLAWTVLSEAMDAEPDAAEPVLDAYRGRFPDEHWGPLLE